VRWDYKHSVETTAAPAAIWRYWSGMAAWREWNESTEGIEIDGCDRALVDQHRRYANYRQADEPIEAVRAGFGASVFECLQALKRRYDPADVLHRNQNIPPSRP
jgi:hypothetical protein